jgi:hypothetical protein
MLRQFTGWPWSLFRDSLLFASPGVVACNESLSGRGTGIRSWRRKTQIVYLFIISTLMGFALSFFPPLFHIFAGVSVPYRLNYVQWTLASAVPNLTAAFIFTERTRRDEAEIRGILWFLFGGMSGMFLGIALDLSIPCDASGALKPCVLEACNF